MHTRTLLIPATTAAVAVQVELDARTVEKALVLAYGLAGAEVMTVFAKIPETGGWQPLFDSAGAALVLDATGPMLTLEGGFTYGFTKAASAGAAGLDAVLRRGA